MPKAQPTAAELRERRDFVNEKFIEYSALDRIHGKVSVISNPSSVPLARLAELGVSRVSFGPGTLGLTLSHLRDAATTLTARGDYPAELGFSF